MDIGAVTSAGKLWHAHATALTLSDTQLPFPPLPQAHFGSSNHWGTVFRPFLIDFHDAELWIFCLALTLLMGCMTSAWWATQARPRDPGPVPPKSKLMTWGGSSLRAKLAYACEGVSCWVEGACMAKGVCVRV